LDTVELLTHFGLTKQEATIYLMLFTEGQLTGYEAAKLTGISRSNTYTVLAGLVEKGAAYLIEGAATRYTPVPLEEFCNNKILQLKDFKRDLIQNTPIQKEEVGGYITIKGEEHILNKIKNMLMESKERAYLSLSIEIIDRIRFELEDRISKGLKIVIITDRPFQLAGATVYHAERSQKQIRLIADSTSVLTGDINEGDRSTCLYSKKKNLVDLFKEALKNEIKLIELTEGKEVE
jgi:HTH-type transcriptional regulator, sugar sensing transcriptional regulator